MLVKCHFGALNAPLWQIHTTTTREIHLLRLRLEFEINTLIKRNELNQTHTLLNSVYTSLCLAVWLWLRLCLCVNVSNSNTTQYKRVHTQRHSHTHTYVRTYIRKRIATATSQFVIGKSKNVFSKHRHCNLNTTRYRRTRFSIRSNFWKIPLFICFFLLSVSNSNIQIVYSLRSNRG